MKIPSLLLAALATGALPAAAAERAYTVATPGICLITPNVGDPQARHQTVVHCFVRDLLRDDPAFRFMTDERAGKIFTQIKSGALDYGTDNLCEVFRRHYLPADIVFDCKVAKGAERYRANVTVSCHSLAAGIREKTFTCGYGAEMSKDVLPQLAEWIIEAAPGLSPETAKRFRAFAKERSLWAGYFYLAQVCKNSPASCSGGEQRYGWLVSAQKNAKGNDPALSAGFTEAAYWTCHCNFSPRPPMTKGKIYGAAANALNFALGGPDEERLRLFVTDSSCPQRSADELKKFAREISVDAESRMLESALEEQPAAANDEFGEEISATAAGPKLSPAQLEARGRGAVRALAWRRDRGMFDEFKRIASVKEAASRRAVAAAIASYHERGKEAPPKLAFLLEKLAQDKDPSVAVAAIESQHAFGIENKTAVARARQLLDAKTVTEGVVGLPAESQALAILARAGDASDEARIRPRLNSGKVPVRREAARALIAKCPFAEVDFALFADPDHTVGMAALGAVPLERLAKDEKLVAAVTKATSDFCDLVANVASARLAESRKKHGVKVDADRVTLATAHPYFRRKLLYRLEGDASSRATDLLAEATENPHAQTRSLALRILSHRDAEKGRAAALGHVGDVHTWVRCRAAEVLSRLAKPEDAAPIKAQLAKERNRVAKLYFADALAKAEGRPKPPPLPSVNTILDGECRNWHCFLTEQSDKSSFNAYYTCDVPRKPTPQVKYAHDVLKKPIYPRPRPTENPLLILTDTAVMDDFWTELEREMPDDVICCVDGVVYGEESMSLDPRQAESWKTGWQIFCAEAGIDPQRVDGKKENLTENEKLAWFDWAEKTGVEGFNELYDFTHFYIGKLRPGLQVNSFCIHYAESVSRWQSMWKCDVPGTYIYSGDVRYMYSSLRWFRTVYPDRPNLWLAGGHVSGDDWNGPATWQSYFSPHPLAFRWDNTYAGNLASFLAGSETGYFSSYGIKNPDDVAGRGGNAGFCTEQIWPPSDPAVSNLEKNVHFGLNKVDRFIRDEMNKAKRANVDPNDFDDDEGTEGALTLEEVGGKDDPAVIALNKLKDRVFWGLLYEHKFVHDTSKALVGLKRRNPKDAPVLMLASVLQHKPGLSTAIESPFGCWFEDYDVQFNFEMAAKHPQFPKYRLISLGWAHQEYMNEETRQLWIRWLRETPGLLVVNDWMDSGVEMAQRSADCIDGDLKTPWPWHGDVEYVPLKKGIKGKTKDEPHFYRVKNAARCTVLEKDDRGEAQRVAWHHPEMKATVVFDLLRGHAHEVTARAFMTKFFADNKVDLKVPEVDRRLWSDEHGLRVEVRGWGCTKTNRYEGCELVTGQWNPKVSALLNAAMVTEEYTAPYVAVHGGVCLFSQTKLNILEKTANGFKVKPDAGLLRITTKSGRPAKITTASGKAPPPYAGDVEHWYVGRTLEEGIATLPAIKVDPKAPVWHFSGGGYTDKMKTIADREDDIPPYLLLRSSEDWVLIEDK